MSLEEQFAGRQDPTQVGAALEALGIDPIAALSPQANGKIEKARSDDRVGDGNSVGGVYAVPSVQMAARF